MARFARDRDELEFEIARLNGMREADKEYRLQLRGKLKEAEQTIWHQEREIRAYLDVNKEYRAKVRKLEDLLNEGTEVAVVGAVDNEDVEALRNSKKSLEDELHIVKLRAEATMEHAREWQNKHNEKIKEVRKLEAELKELRAAKPSAAKTDGSGVSEAVILKRMKNRIAKKCHPDAVQGSEKKKALMAEVFKEMQVVLKEIEKGIA